MSHQIHFPILEKLGLSTGEVVIYELLLESGRSKARDLVVPSGLGRGNVYNILLQLEAKGLVLTVQGNKTLYEAVEPSHLQGLVDSQLRSVKELQASFSNALDGLASMYNLSTGKPTVQVFEGLEGLEKSIEDSLQSKTEICSFIDVKSLTGELAAINVQYVKKRINKKIQKNILVADTSETREFFAKQNTPFTKVGFIKGYPESFSTAMEIYDGTISYFTLSGDKKISVVIKDKLIYQTHKTQFDWLWQQAEIIDYEAKASEAGLIDGNSTSSSKAI